MQGRQSLLPSVSIMRLRLPPAAVPQVVFSLIQGLGTNKLRHIFCAVLCLVPRLRKFVKPCSKG
jgi:hypothetical protein